MSLFDGTLTGPLAHEIVLSINGLMQASGDIVDGDEFLLDADHAFLYESEEPHPKRYTVVRRRDQVGGMTQSISGTRIVPVQIMISIHRDKGNPQQFLGWAHDKVRSVVQGQKPTLTTCDLQLPYYMEIQPNSPMFDDAQNEWYSTALYYAVAKPI